ncbi:MAG TPA: hypothetical protein VH351_16105 [Bryobacteraceae bacterium]|jgi:hypothetical protein|nr:hypothetical protein [Bryobacteraceae bacterium]
MHKNLLIAAFSVALLSATLCPAQPASAKLVVTIEPKRGKAPASIESPDVRLTAAGKPAPITALTPVGDSPIQLLLLIDDSAGSSLSTEFNTIKDFIRALPPSVQIGVGYMRNGMVDYVQQFTADHASAANSIRLPFGAGGADVSPYDSLSYAVQHWAPAPDIQRREVIMISSGIEGLGGGLAPENQYVNKSISDAQRAGVVVFGIYNPSVGHFGHTLWRMSIGQNLLSQLCDETGGESYINTFGPAVDFGPYLNEIRQALANQYIVTFTTPAVRKPSLVPVKVKVPEKDADVAAPAAVYVKP